MRTGGRAGGQTDVTKLIVAFRNLANAPRKNTKHSKTLIVWGRQPVIRGFSRGALETNPGEKREMIMSVIVGR